MLRGLRAMFAGAHGERAQGVVEFALISTILMLLFLGTADFGRLLYYGTVLQSSARVGAETAINHCAQAGTGLCGVQAPVPTDDEVLHAATCEVRTDVILNPAPTGTNPCAPCAPGVCSFTPTPISGACQGATITVQCCEKDVCISPGPASSRSSGTDVTVYVGYNFRPISFLMSPFLGTKNCFPAGSRTNESAHTLCAQFTGRVY